MPEFKLNGKIYDIPEDIVEQFLKDNPNAETLNGLPDFNNSKVRKQFGFNYGEEQKYLRNKTIPERLKNKLGKTTPTTPGAVVEETAAPELTLTESPSVDISLDLPEIKTRTVDSTIKKPKTKTDSELKIDATRNAMSLVNPIASVMPDFMIPVLADWTAMTAETAAGAVDTAEIAYEMAISPDWETFDKISRKQRIDMSEVYEGAEALRNIREKKYDSNGNELDAIGLWEAGRKIESAQQFASEAIGSLPSTVLTYMLPGAGSLLIGAGTLGKEFETNLKERPQETAGKMLLNASIKGGSEAFFEWVGGYTFKQITKAGGRGLAEKAIKELTKDAVPYVLGKVLGVGAQALSEATTEALTGVTQLAADELVFDDPIEAKQYWRTAIHSGIVGGLMGGGITAGAVGVQLTGDRKKAALSIIAPKQWKSEQIQIGKEIDQAIKDYQAAPPNKKKFFQNKIEVLEQRQQGRADRLAKTWDGLTKTEKMNYARLLDEANSQLDIIGNNKYTRKAQDDAQLNLNEAYSGMQSILGKDNINADVEQAISKTLKASQSILEQVEKAKTIKNLNIQSVSNEIFQEVSKAVTGKKSAADAIFFDGNNIYINKDISAVTEQTNVVGHELLHYLMAKNFDTSNESMQPLVDSFKDYLKETQPEIFERVESRINSLYTDEKTGEIKKGALEEYLNVFSDLIAKEKIVVNESFSDKIKNATTRFLNGLGFGSIKLETGKDVFNFIRNYNKNISNFKYKQLGIDITSDKITKGVNEEVAKESISGEKIQKIFDEKGKDGAFDIIEAYKPLTTKLTNKYRDVPGFDFELLQSEIEIGKRGLLDLINAYDASKGATLNTYIQGQLANRSIEAANRILDTEFKLDVTEAKGVTDATTQETAEAVEEKPSKELTSLRKTMGIDDEIKPVVFDAVRKTFGTRLPSIDDKTFRKELEKRYRTELKKPIAKLFGKGEEYRSFLANNFESIYNALPQSIFNKRLKEFAEPVLDKDGKQIRERTAEGNKVFTKKKITKAEFIKYFLGDDVKRSTQGTRKTAIAEAVAEAFAFDATMEVLSEPEVLEKAQAIADLQGIPIPDNFIEQISLKVGRPVSFKFSKSTISDKANKYGFEYYDLLSKENIDKHVAAIKSVVERSDYPQGLFTGSMFVFKADEQFNGDNELKEYFEQKLQKINFGKSEKISGNITRFGKTKASQAFGGTFEHKNKSKRTKEKIKAYNVKNGLMFDTFWNYLYDISNDPEFKISPLNILYMVASSSSARNHPHALGARIVSIGKDKSGKIEWEHAVQNVWAFNFLFDSIQTKNKEDFNKDLKALKKNYTLIGLSKTENNKITAAGYQKEMPLIEGKEWNVYNNFWWQRYLNDKVNTVDGGIDVSNQEWFDEAENPFEKYNSKGVQIKQSRSLNKEFNEQILQATTGVKWTENYSPATAKMLAKGKGKGNLFIPYSAEDFVGLLYTTLAEREVGNKQMEWYNENLIRPFSRGIQAYEAEKQRAMREWSALKQRATKDVPGGLKKKNESGFTNEESLRMYIWQRQGMEIPNIQKGEVNKAIRAVRNNKKFKEFADTLMSLNPEGYPKPSNNWIDGDITSDLIGYVNGAKRAEFLTEWKNNVDQIFSEKNKTKLRALYGDRYVEALEDILFRMEKGTNRSRGTNKQTRAWMNWVNNSVGTIMFFNARSAVLQTLSTVNFINFSDNNPINAAAALANFGQYRKDFVDLFNSDFLKQRRSGLQIDVNADEIAKATKGNEKSPRAILRALLQFGFTPTQIADSFAIAAGGATFYRNRINKYIKEGLSETDAQKKAFTDFQEIAEETQQSARPDRISMEQASSLGRVILAFANTPMQYARLQKKAFLDLINRRGDWKTNTSKIMYYGVIQNVIFSALQNALFALLFDDEDEAEEKSRYYKIANSSFDTLLRGVGVAGAGVATVKNIILEIIEQTKSGRPDYEQAAIAATSISPPINSKLKKLLAAGRAFTYKQSKEKIFTEGLSLENPALLATGQVLSAGTNIPADRIIIKADHLYTAMQPETELWQAIALSLGWSEWDLGMIEKQTKKPRKLKPKFKTNSFNSGFKTKKFK